MSFPELNLDLINEDLQLICRSCLSSTGVLKNMIDWGLADDFYKITGIQVTEGDCMTTSLCLPCEDILLKCLRFKLQSSQADLMLKQTAKKKINNDKGIKNDNKIEDILPLVNVITNNLQDNKLTLFINAPDKDVKLYLPCPFFCDTKFLKKSDLLSHITKYHDKGSDFTVDLKFHCSHFNCPYHANSEKNKYFTNRKLLNQHDRKVHKEKNIQCEMCEQKFAVDTDCIRHMKTCSFLFMCQVCNKNYVNNERLLVHLMRKHPELHERHKQLRKAEKRKSQSVVESKKIKSENEKLSEYICDSPKRSFATQTLKENIRNDVTLSWQPETKTDEISTQTVFEDLLSLKSQTSEDDSIFFSETVSLSDIQTQTFPLEFGLTRSNKETITSETQSPDLSIKETQTCFCLYDSPRPRASDRISPNSNASFSMNVISTETQTLNNLVDGDVMSFNSAETQTSFDDVGLCKDNDSPTVLYTCPLE